MGKGENSLAKIGKITRIVILVYIVSSIAYAGLGGYSTYFASAVIADTISSDGNNAMIMLSLVAGVVSLISTASFLTSIVLVAIWVYRAWANLHEARLEGLNFSPGWATASFFIPVVNAFIPMRALRELHNRSHGESDWHAAISVGDVTSWYACTWAAFLVGIATAGYVAVDLIPNVHVLLPMAGIFGLIVLLLIFTLGSAYFLMRIVTSVTAAQSLMLHHAQAEVFE